MRGDDVFTALAPLLQVRPELQLLCRFGHQWAAPHAPEPGGWAPFHIVTEGACLLDVGGRTGIRLEASDVAILPHGSAHTTRSVAETGTVPPVRLLAHGCGLGIKTNAAAEAEIETRLICGRLQFDFADRNMVLAALPPVIVIAAGSPDAQRSRRLVEMMAAELEENRLGAASVAASLAATLMMLVLRAHVEEGAAHQGVLALLAQRQTARALAAMLAEPARDWTLDALACQAGASRATLVRLFRKAAGIAPLAFLAELRLNLARRRIRANDEPLALIAEAVGYQSETAFSRAYQRRFERAPGADRQR